MRVCELQRAVDRAKWMWAKVSHHQESDKSWVLVLSNSQRPILCTILTRSQVGAALQGLKTRELSRAGSLPGADASQTAWAQPDAPLLQNEALNGCHCH